MARLRTDFFDDLGRQAVLGPLGCWHPHRPEPGPRQGPLELPELVSEPCRRRSKGEPGLAGGATSTTATSRPLSRMSAKALIALTSLRGESPTTSALGGSTRRGRRSTPSRPRSGRSLPIGGQRPRRNAVASPSRAGPLDYPSEVRQGDAVPLPQVRLGQGAGGPYGPGQAGIVEGVEEEDYICAPVGVPLIGEDAAVAGRSRAGTG